MATVKVTLSDLIDDGELDGYRRRAPQFTLGDGIDDAVCRESTCSFCGHQGCVWVPFVGVGRRSYRAFAECPACHHVEEF